MLNEILLPISIKDFGIGLTKKNQEKVFDRIFRVNDSTVNTYPGLGFGLYVCQEIVKGIMARFGLQVLRIKDQDFLSLYHS